MRGLPFLGLSDGGVVLVGRGHVRRIPLARAQSLVQVGPQSLDIFEPDRQAHQVVVAVLRQQTDREGMRVGQSCSIRQIRGESTSQVDGAEVGIVAGQGGFHAAHSTLLLTKETR